MLLQLIARLLLSNLRCVPSELHSFIGAAAADDDARLSTRDIGCRSREILLRCVKQCLTTALEFDARPGLKFLIQKVANIDCAANLYKQMTSSWMIYYVAHVDNFLSDCGSFNLAPEDLTHILDTCSRLNTTAAASSGSVIAAKKDKRRENFVRYLFQLQDAWNLICEIYLNNCGGGGGGGAGNELSLVDRSANQMNDEVVANGAGDMGKTIQQHHRRNPFDVAAPSQQTGKPVDVTEIDQQRALSILKDGGFKRSSLSQLVIASMELLQSLPNDNSANMRVMVTPTIREAFRIVELHMNDHFY